LDASARLTSKGQVTLPKAVRESLGLRAGDSVIFRVEDGRAILAKTPDFLDLAGSVAVPPAKRGSPWASLRAEAWTARTRRSS